MIEYIELANIIEDQIFIKNLKHEYIYCNKAFADYAKISTDEIKGKKDIDIVANEKADFYILKDNEVITTRKTVKYVSDYLMPDGKMLYFETKKSPYYNNNGSIAGIIGISRDITDKITAEKKYRANYYRLENLIINMNSAVLVENADRKIIIVNQKLIDIYNIPAKISDMIGKDCSNAAEDIKHMVVNPNEFIIRIEELLLKRNLQTNDIIEFTDGRFFSRDYIPVFDSNAFYGQMWVYRDITTQINFEKERENFIKQISESNIRITREAQRFALLKDILKNSGADLTNLESELDSIQG